MCFVSRDKLMLSRILRVPGSLLKVPETVERIRIVEIIRVKPDRLCRYVKVRTVRDKGAVVKGDAVRSSHNAMERYYTMAVMSDS